MDTINWIFALITGAVIIGVLFLVLRPGRKKSVEDGEQTVKSMLEKLGEEYAVFSDLVVPAQHGMSHIDFVMVSPYGVFVIDAKHEAGKIFGDIGEREWGVGKNQTIYNPVWRNRTHLNALEKLLGHLPYVSLVVFVNGRLKNNFGANVVELPKMIRFIKGYQRQTLESEQQQEAIKLLGEKGQSF